MSFLRDLYDLSLRLEEDGELSPNGYEEKAVAYIIRVDSRTGSITADDLRDQSNRMRGVKLVIPTRGRSGSAAPPNLVADNLQYVGAVAKDNSPKAASKAASLQSEWCAMLTSAGEAIGGDEGARLLAIRDAVAANPSGVQIAVAAAPGPGLPIKAGEAAALVVAFRVDGVDPTSSTKVRAWWSAHLTDESSGDLGICQITGLQSPIARTFDPVKLPGNQPKLVSANFEPAERYGSSQSSGARVSVDAAQRTSTTLNWLLSNDAHHRRLGDSTLVWWVPEDPALEALDALTEPTPEGVAAVLRGVWSGTKRASDLSFLRATLLSVNTARVVVRSDLSVTLGQLRQNLDRYFASQRPAHAVNAQLFGLKELAAAAARRGRQGPQLEQVNSLLADLLSFAVTGRPVPVHHLAGVVRRCRAERSVSDERAALISLILHSHQEGNMEQTPAYTCGELFAEYERLQSAALGSVNRSIVDSFYSTAMTRPSMALPAVEKKAQAHLRKLRRDKPGLAVNISKAIGELMSLLGSEGGFPRFLTIGQQAEFVLGYWCRRQQHFNPTSNDKEEATT